MARPAPPGQRSASSRALRRPSKRRWLSGASLVGVVMAVDNGACTTTRPSPPRWWKPGSPAPTVRAITPPDLDTAYAAQAHVGRALRWFDGVPRHWKSGGASRTALQTHAPLPPAGVWASPADAQRLALPLARHRSRGRLAPGRGRRPPNARRRWTWTAPARWSMRWRCPSRSSIRAGSKASRRRRWRAWPTCNRMARWCWGPGCPSMRSATGRSSAAPWPSASRRRRCSPAPTRWPIRPLCCRPGCATPRATASRCPPAPW